ncbi:MAG: hypothetical protein K8T90_16430 [Planctomycetes bacterium]|nr:hypothetical protein [Planctomycetota bacterium]
MADEGRSRGGLGCIGTVITVIILWAIVFGVTVGGRHYGTEVRPRALK